MEDFKQKLRKQVDELYFAIENKDIEEIQTAFMFLNLFLKQCKI